MTSAPPPPPEPAWNFHQSDPVPELEGAGSARAAKPKHTVLLVTLGVIVGLLGVTGASAAVLKVTTGSYLPSGDPGAASSAADPSATKKPADLTEPTEPTKPTGSVGNDDLSQVMRQEPDRIWQVTGRDSLPDADERNLSLPFSNPQGTANTSDTVALVTRSSADPDKHSIVGVRVADGKITWTHAPEKGAPGSCFTLGAGETLGCIGSADSESSWLLFLDVQSGAVVAETTWDRRAMMLSGTPEDLFIAGVSDGLPYLARGSAQNPAQLWLTESEADDVAAMGVYALALTFDDEFAQFTVNADALLVDVGSGKIVADLRSGFANVIPGLGTYQSQDMSITEVHGAFETLGFPWAMHQKKMGVRPTIGIGDTMFDAHTGTPLWSIPPDDSEMVLSNRTFQLDNHVLRATDTSETKSTIVAFDARTGAELWNRAMDFGFFTIIDTWGNVAVVQAYSSYAPVAVVGLDTASGDTLWEVPFQHVSPDAHGLNEPVQIIGSTVVVLDSNNLVAYSATP